MTDDGSARTITGPAGLGGWLILIVILQFGAIYSTLKSLVGDVLVLRTVRAEHVHAIYFELAMLIAFLCLNLWTTVQLFRTKRVFPTLWKVQGVAAILFPFVVGFAIAAMLGVPVSTFFQTRGMEEFVAAPIAVGIGWWYLNASVRVKNTFVN